MKEYTCNLCGETCTLKDRDSFVESGGLLECTVSGGYGSTPGNGFGALDDTIAYTFSLCEFCLDWLFGQCKIPVVLSYYMQGDENLRPPEWQKAIDRVTNDEWRKFKDEFITEWKRRNAIRIAK